jgi:hypothetical protein
MAGSVFDRVNGVLIDRVILVDADAEPVTATNRVPIELPDEQAPPAAITNYALETGGFLADVRTNSDSLPLIKAQTDNIPVQGQAPAATSLPVVLPVLQAADLKIVTIKDNPLTMDSKLMINAMPYGFDVAEGNIADHYPFSKLGFNADVDAAEEDLWAVGGKYVWPAAEQRMEVVSSSALDTADGTGAQSVHLVYLDSDFVEHTEDIELAGLTPVATEATDIYRINHLWVLTAGTGGVAAGDIDIRNLANTPIYSRIPSGLTRARNAIYTVPAGICLYISQINYSIGSSKGGVFGRFSFRANYNMLTDMPSTLMYPYSEVGVDSQSFSVTFTVPMRFCAGVDMLVAVQGDATNADAVCSTQYRGWTEVDE